MQEGDTEASRHINTGNLDDYSDGFENSLTLDAVMTPKTPFGMKSPVNQQ